MTTAPDRSDSRPHTADVAALAAATDAAGNVNALAYEAQRLILRHQGIGGIDAPGLAGALRDSPGLAQFGVHAMAQAIAERLPTQAERDRLDRALDAANLTDTPLERLGERIVETAGTAIETGREAARWADDYLTRTLSWSYQWSQDAAADSNSTPGLRAAADLAREAVAQSQRAYGIASGGTVHALELLQDTVELPALAVRLIQDREYREVLVNAALLYAAQTLQDSEKPVRDVAMAGAKALLAWRDELQQATLEGREQQFLGNTAGAVGVELLALTVPETRLPAFAKLVRGAHLATPDALGESLRLALHPSPDAPRLRDLLPNAELPDLPDGDGLMATRRGPGRGKAGDAGVLDPEPLRDALDDAIGGAVPGSRLATRAGAQLEDVARDGLLHAQVALLRREGQLQPLIDAARATRSIDGLLRSGELAPGELAAIAKLDASFFNGKVDFNQAVAYSTRGVDLARLSSSQLGEMGEALFTWQLLQKGHTDIVAVKNASGHGIDVISRDAQGELVFYEVKTTAAGHMRAQRGDPEEFITARLERAITADRHWAPHNTLPGLDELASRIQAELINPDTRKIEVRNARWVQMELGHEPGTRKLTIDSTEVEWTKPVAKNPQALLTEPGHVDYPLYQQAHALLQRFDADNGCQRSDLQREQLAAALTVRAKDQGFEQMHHIIGINDGARLFAIDLPDSKSLFRRTAHVDSAEAQEQSLATTHDELARVDARLAQHAIDFPPRSPDDPNRGGPVMS